MISLMIWKKSVVQKYTKNLEILLGTISQCTNPFSNELSTEHLYNISSGQSVSNEVYEFLSSVETVGNKQRLKFIVENSNDSERFDRPITKNRITNFAFKNKKKVNIYNKIKEIKIQRDVFGQLLFAAMQNGIDIEKALSYPLTPVPFSLCHNDGNICKTPKSVILQELKSYQTSTDYPVEPDITDNTRRIYLLHTFSKIPERYAAISNHILKNILFEKKKKPAILSLINTITRPLKIMSTI